MRLDKWLWVARFYKTRSLASEAVSGGKVKLNRSAVKPARELKPGDLVELRAAEQEWSVIVRGLAEQRRPAVEARLLYEETAASSLARAQAAELRALAPVPGAEQKGRPTKRERRQLSRFQGG